MEEIFIQTEEQRAILESVRRFVEDGLENPPANPLNAAREGWVLGGETFFKKIKRLVVSPKHPDEVPAAKRLATLDPLQVITTVAAYYDESPENYARRRSAASGRDLAAYLAHRRTTATLRSLATHFGLRHPDSLSNLTPHPVHVFLHYSHPPVLQRIAALRSGS